MEIAKEYKAFLVDNEIIYKSYGNTENKVMSTSEIEHVKQILNFFQIDYSISENKVKAYDQYLLERRVNTFIDAHQYLNAPESHNIIVGTFLVLTMALLIFLMLIPTLLFVWSGLGFLQTILVIGVQFFLGIFLMIFSYKLLPLTYFIAAFISFMGIGMIHHQSNRMSRFMAWSTIPFVPLFFNLSFFTWFFLNDGMGASFIVLFVLATLLLIVSLLMTAFFSFMASDKTALPRAN